MTGAPRRCRLLYLCLAGVVGSLAAQDAVRTGLEGLAWQSPETVHAAERALITGLREPLLAAKDCAAALQYWFDGRMADARGDKGAAIAAWEAAGRALSDLGDLPSARWPETGDVRLKPRHAVSGTDLYLVNAFVIQWPSDVGTQYGLFMVPASRPEGHRFPLLVYVHGGRAGMGGPEILWLAEQCRKGYAILAPALRGQPLAASLTPELSALRSQGDADDPAGEAMDVLAAVQGAQAMPVVRPGGCALVGLGHGATVALLAGAHSALPACLAVADARQLNPFRAYWARLSRGENAWPDWETFCSREPADQLATMRRRSVAHEAGHIGCPVLMLTPENAADSVDGQSERDVAAAIRNGGHDAIVEPWPGTQAGFTDALRQAPCRDALRRLLGFVYQHVPSDDGKDALLRPSRTPEPLPPGN